jgi:outer membrane lipoprotein
MKTIGVLFGITLFFQGCTYAVSPAMVEKADKKITFEKLRADPDLYKGKLVIIGGTIDQVTNLKQGTLLEVVQKPLDYWGKPKRTDRSGGRFLVLHPRYLDALVYAPGREITVAAQIEGTSSKTLGDTEYAYPIVISKELKLWARERQSWDRPQWIDPLYDPSSPGRHDW